MIDNFFEANYGGYEKRPLLPYPTSASQLPLFKLLLFFMTHWWFRSSSTERGSLVVRKNYGWFAKKIKAVTTSPIKRLESVQTKRLSNFNYVLNN